MHDLAVIEQPDVARIALDPIRLQILHSLSTPGSASTVAASIDLPRQKVNYHLRQLEDHGLVELVEERPRRGLTERIVQATAASYAVAPGALGGCTPDPDALDQLSSSYLIALAARLVSEVGALTNQARLVGKTLPTLAIDTEVTFASPADRQAFTAELADAVTSLAAKYHHPQSPNGRPHRLVVGAHPLAKEDHT